MACCEAEIDCLSGNFVVRRMDIVMDVGHSLAPNLDIGQIEGAVVQVATVRLWWTVQCTQDAQHARSAKDLHAMPSQRLPLDSKDAPAAWWGAAGTPATMHHS